MRWLLDVLRINWRYIAIGIAISGIFYAGYHTHTVIYEAQQAEALRAAIAAKEAAEKKNNETSKSLEASLAKERQKNTTLTMKWGLHAKNLADCNLSDTALGLLQTPDSGASADPR